ncbi:MAG TPA: FAD-dependent monooxygenase [Verrucomicrobiae bacterium]|nr:FAD-dependent monooxygenase [Verrucomicrobiae bacterium]
MEGGKVLISGGGIAGLTLGILLKEKGYEPTIIERDPAIRTEGYVIDFFSTGWDVARRMNLIGELRKIIYPIDSLEYVDADGRPYLSLPIESVRNALDGEYTYMQRSDLERVLFDRAKTVGFSVRFNTTIKSLEENVSEVVVTFQNDTKESYALVFGADGVHSRVRELTFGPESQFDRFLGYYVAAFHIEHHHYNIGRSLAIYEEPNRSLWVYSLGENRLSAIYVFRHKNIGYVPPAERLPLLQETYCGAGWLAENILADFPATQPIFFDSATQIVMPAWSKGRIALLGDACACLTLLAGQGSHLAMAEAYVIAQELERHGGDYRTAFAAYEKTLQAVTKKKQRDAIRISKFFVPSKRSFVPLRRLLQKTLFSNLLIRYGLEIFGLKSALSGYQ